MYTAVNTAAADMRGEKVTYLSAPIVVNATGVKEASPSAVGTSKEFTFVNPLGTIEDFDPFAEQIKKRDGVLGVNGSERSITVKWDPAKLDEAKVRSILSDLGHAVR
jgi:hypothetical protein